MKIFQSIQQYFKILEITQIHANEQSTLNFRHLIILGLLSTSIFELNIYLNSVAETFEEYTECLYGLFTMTMFAAEYGIHIWRMKKIFKFIENFEQLIESSKLN